MAQTLKVKKGDVVHILRGKDRGKEGRVLEAIQGRPSPDREPEHGQAASSPAPIQNSSRMGGPQIIPGGIFEQPAPVNVSNVMVVCPTCKKPTRVATVSRTVKDKTVRVRVCKNEGCGQEIK